MKTILLVLIYAVAYIIYLVLNVVYAPLRAIEKSQTFVANFGKNF